MSEVCSRTLDRYGIKGRLKQLVVGHVGVSDGETDGDEIPRPLLTNARLVEPDSPACRM
jgi:hypothetical protein